MNGNVTRNLINCTTKQFRFFPSKNDTLAFKSIKFQGVLIFGDEQNVATQIILLNSYSSADLIINASLAENEFSILKNYLDEQLNISPKDIREYLTGGAAIKGYKWVTDSLTYVLRLIPPQNKKKQKTYTINVKIF